MSQRRGVEAVGVTKNLRVGALQLTAHDRAAFESGAVNLREQVEQAAQACDLLVLPEGTFPAYVLGADDVDTRHVDAALEELRSVARLHGCVIVAGAAMRERGDLFNSAVVIDADGTIAGTAEKIFLWHFDRKWFAPGMRIEPIETRAGRLGVMICADGRMPAIAQTLVDRGAELLVMPTAWVTSGRDPLRLENIQADLLARVRARENNVPFVAANKCGTERGMVLYCGKSQIVDASGEIVAMAPEREPAFVHASLTLNAPRPYRVPLPAVSPVAPAQGFERVAFSLDGGLTAQTLAILDADVALTASDDACIDASLAYDPRTLIAFRNAGHRRIALRVGGDGAAFESIARARAAELRLYLIVFDPSRDRAYAVDPDGTIVAGTFGDFRIASVAIDYRRTNETSVAPGTDVERGLRDVAAIAQGARA